MTLAPTAQPSVELETTRCPLCDAPEAAVVTRAFAPCLVLRCRSCSLAYLSPRWTEDRMRAYYARDDYYLDEEDSQGERSPAGAGQATGYSGYDRQAQALKLTFARFMKNLARRDFTGGELLEIGCGYGYLLEAARPYFTHTTGTDYSPAAVQRARQQADRVIEGGLEELPAGRFDLIVLNQVIEHVYRPGPFLSQLYERLRPGGRLVLATPDMNSPLRFVMGRRWPSYKIPEHVLYFTEGSLGAALGAAGFARVGRLPYPHAFPLGLLLEKFKLPRPGRLDRFPIWVPWTTLAMYGEKSA